MNILIVCSGNAPDFVFEKHQAFIYDQVIAIKKLDDNIEFDYFFIKGKGCLGYLKNLSKLKQQIKLNKYDLIHAHFALSGLLANLQRKVQVITTFHGSDINKFSLRIISAFVELLSNKTIYVSDNLYKKALIKFKQKSSIIPCGVDFNIFYPHTKSSGNENQDFKFNAKKKILFSSSFDNPVKNFKLLERAISMIQDYDFELIELKGFNRKEVALLMNKVDICVMTSISEGSPQFIKEAMACSCPIVSTDVGDVKQIIAETEGCFVTSYDPKDVANKIIQACRFNKKTNGSQKISYLDNKIISKKIISVYNS